MQHIRGHMGFRSSRFVKNEDATPMFSYSANLKIMTKLLKAVADPNIKNDRGRTVLMETSMGGNPSILGALLKSAAHVDEQSDDGDTALMIAAQMFSPKAVKLLLEAGADIHLEDKKGRKAKDRTSHRPTRKLLRNAE